MFLTWLLFDVDGVFTNGVLYYGQRGEVIKPFHVRDGLACRMAQRAGLRLGLLSGRSSRPLERRAAELGFDDVILGSGDKRQAFEFFLARHELTATEVAYIGDDLPDLLVLHYCGLSFAPADAAPEVSAAVDVILSRRGGDGAVREMIEMILKARGDWPLLVAGFATTD